MHRLLFPCVSSIILRHRDLGGVGGWRYRRDRHLAHRFRGGAMASASPRRPGRGAARTPVEGPHCLVRGDLGLRVSGRPPGPPWPNLRAPGGSWPLRLLRGLCSSGSSGFWSLSFPLGFTLGLWPRSMELCAELMSNTSITFTVAKRCTYLQMGLQEIFRIVFILSIF